MDFWDKLAKITAETSTKSRAAKAAGLPASAISNYISKRQMPRADKAFSLARALGVPLEWLINDAQDWPPPKPKEQPSLRDIADGDLLREIATRERRAILEFYEAIKAAESIDWKRATEELRSLQPADPLPDRVQQAMMALLSVELKFARSQHDFSLYMFSILNHDSLPGGDRKFEDLTGGPGFALKRLEDREDITRFHQLAKSRPEWTGSPWRKSLLAYHSAEQEHHRRLHQARSPTRSVVPEHKSP